MRRRLAAFLKRFALPFLLILAFFLLFNSVSAATVDVGIDQVDSGIGLENNSPTTIVIRIIQIILGLLGIISVVIVIYGGFLWMTSSGSEEKISKAKILLKNAVIGLIIILSSWGIVYFVLTKLLGISDSVSLFRSPSNVSNSNNLSLGALGSCSLESVYPSPGATDVPRNSTILITAKEAFQLDTVCLNKDTKKPCACDNTANCNLLNFENIQIYQTNEGNSCSPGNCGTNLKEVEVSVPAGNKTIVLKPLVNLGAASGKVEYGVKLTNDLKKFGGEALFSSCSSDYLEWFFEVSNTLDLTPPQVTSGGFFPQVDNAADLIKINSEAKAASGKIVITSCPNTYTPASLSNITKIGNSVDVEVLVNPNYSGIITDFKVEVAGNKMRLFSGNSLLDSVDIVNNEANFSSYFLVKLSSVSSGNSWNIIVKPVQAADTLAVGSNSYIFADREKNANNEIAVPDNCSPTTMATNIEIALSGHKEINVVSSGGTLTLFAKQTGTSGNSLPLSSSAKGLELQPFSGGAEKSDSYEIRGVQDKPMNSIIQINFNEPINPMVLSGTSDELSNFVQIVNANASAKSAGESCSLDSDCLSYSCQATKCAGNYISGTFSLDSSYQTAEFVSNKECGVNSCGEKMYCLPASSHLAVRLKAATLKSCSTVSDCGALAPYSECVSSVCHNSSTGENYPVANSLQLDGIVDLAFNSLDGNRDGLADGPIIKVYPYFVEGDANLEKRDGFEFSFFISNQLNLTPPSIALTSPRLEEDGVMLSAPVVIDFNDLMMQSTLKSGSLSMSNELVKTEHKLINLKSSVDKPLGYWIESENKEIGTLDGIPDYTSARILHSDFFESVTYISQIGSGVKNIYQNCFKPSIGPGCFNLSEANPSCCFGEGTNALDANGNCAN